MQLSISMLARWTFPSSSPFFRVESLSAGVVTAFLIMPRCLLLWASFGWVIPAGLLGLISCKLLVAAVKSSCLHFRRCGLLLAWIIVTLAASISLLMFR